MRRSDSLKHSRTRRDRRVRQNISQAGVVDKPWAGSAAYFIPCLCVWICLFLDHHRNDSLCMIAILRALLQSCVHQFIRFLNEFRLAIISWWFTMRFTYQIPGHEGWYLEDAIAMIQSGDYRFPTWLKWCNWWTWLTYRNFEETSAEFSPATLSLAKWVSTCPIFISNAQAPFC